MALGVKICGLKTSEAMAAALDSRADYVGLVFFPPSPRYVTFDTAAALADQARGNSKIVALAVDADDALLDQIMNLVSPDMLQLHGSENPARVDELRGRYGCSVMKAIKVATAADAFQALAYAQAADLILFDAKPPKGAVLPGGNGVAFDWRLLDGIKDQVPFMLSGGLDAANVADAIRATDPLAVDVSSGVETAPGVKDPTLVRAFIAAVRAYAPEAQAPPSSESQS